jgi:hypothetical protein
VTIATSNTFVGDAAGYTFTSGVENVAVGQGALYSATGHWNTAVGRQAGFLHTGGNSNTFLGCSAGYADASYANSVCVGYFAGKYETVGSKLFIDGLDRTDLAGGQTKSLIYGLFNATVATQSLTVNAGAFTINGGTDSDITLNFTGTTYSGLLNWMEDEDYFKFSDDLLMNSTENIYFRDTDVYIASLTDGHLDLTADVSIDLNAAVVLGGELDAGAHSIGFTQQTATGDGTTTIDWKLGNKFYFTFSATTPEAFTFTAPTKPGDLTLVLKQYSTGGQTASWPGAGAIKWAGTTPPTLSTGNNAIDIISFYWDGSNYYGSASLNFA